MKVDSSQNMITTQNQPLSETVNTVSAKNFNDLKPGDVFKAKVTDIQPNQVTIQLESGSSLTAKSLVLPEARIGEESVFMVTENFKGQILLEMVKPQANTLQNNIIREALTNAGLFPSADNMELAKALITADLPLDSQTLQKAAFFHYAGDSSQALDIDKVLFLLQENIPLQEKNIDTLNGLLHKTIRLSDNLTGMIEELFKMSDKASQMELLTILLNARESLTNAITPGNDLASVKNTALQMENEASSALSDTEELLAQLWKAADKSPEERDAIVNRIKTVLHKEFLIELRQDGALKDLNHLYKVLHETTSKMLETTQTADMKGEVVNQLANIKNGLEFMDHIQQYKEYMQIPFSVDGRENNGELFIFKDGRHEKKTYEQASVLIALDCFSLGRVEAFINKNGRSLQMQFRGNQDDTLKLINRHAYELGVALADKGYVLSGITVKKMTEPFAITDKLAQEKKEPPKRYTFDMRV